MKRALACMLVAVMAGLLFTGCNTIRGAGKDIERGGQAIQDSTK